MFKALLRWGPELCVEVGRKILFRLRANPILAEAADELAKVQDSFQKRLTFCDEALEALGQAIAVRGELQRKMAEGLRTFAMSLLSINGNRHDSDWYLRYYPLGYGQMTRGTAEEVCEDASIVLRKLEDETDAWIVSFRERLTAARDALAAAIEDADAKTKVHKEALQLLRTERRFWVAGLSASRLKAQRVYLDDKPYLRWLFQAALPKKSSSPVSEAPASEKDAASETPDGTPNGIQSETPVVPRECPPIAQEVISGQDLITSFAALAPKTAKLSGIGTIIVKYPSLAIA